MSIESPGLKFTPEKPEVSQTERDLNEIIPILAHGLVRRIEQKGFSGKVRVQAMAGDSWGVAKSPDNSTDIPNVIIYPRESLAGDRRVVNAQLRHEIGNLNYPIDGELNALRGWCYENKVAPELLTSLVEATHEASVNYLEMQNSHSDQPEENFRALYEQEINTQEIANGIPQSAPYKQAVDLTLLYSLSQVGLVQSEQFEQALKSAHPAVQEIFDKQTRSVLNQSVKMAVPKKQVQLVRDFIWPKFSKLVALSGPTQTESEATKAGDKKAEMSPEASARAQQAKEIQEKMQKLMEKMKQKPQSKAGKKPSKESQNKQKKESKQSQKQELSPAEKQERKDEENLLAENLQEQLQQAKEQLEKLQKPGQQPENPKPQEKASMQEIGKQAEQMKAEAEKAMQEAKEAGADEITEEQLQKLKEQLEQLEEVAKQIAESGALEEELAKPEEEPIVYNIKEYGINEAELTPEQLENLQKVRTFAQGTSKAYRTVMRLLMTGYQQKNPNFTDKMIQKMMERGYDVPDFSIHGSQSAQEFLSQREELGIDSFSDNFLINFQLPKPLAKFWYKGGNGSKSQPVKDGEIEWGHFYRMAMPMIYNGVDRAGMQGLYLNRLNQFGQHDPKKYYYLWEAINTALENEANESDESDESEDSEKDEGEDQGSGQEAIDQLLEKLDQMQQSLEAGGTPQDMAGQMQEATRQLSEIMPDMRGDQNDQEGQGNETDFSHPDEELIKELRNVEHELGSKFSAEGEDGLVGYKAVSNPEYVGEMLKQRTVQEIEYAKNQQVEALVTYNKESNAKLEKMYREASGLEGDALHNYIEYMESMKEFIHDLTDFFVKKFKLDREYMYERNQRRGARLQRGFTQNVLGEKEGKVVMNPRSFERKRPAEKPQILWSIIIDNSHSTSSENILENEKRLAVALMEVAKNLDFPLEIITFSGSKQFKFIKKFEDGMVTEDLEKVVALNSGQIATPDIAALDAASTSIDKFAGQFKRAYKFVYFLTDGKTSDCEVCDGLRCESHSVHGSIEEIIKKHKRESTVMAGVGIAKAAETVAKTWGKNAVEVPDVKRLSDAFIRKVEDQIDSTFD